VSALSDRKMNSFRADYAPLSGSHVGWASVALLPWDEAIFGFPVADLRLGPEMPKLNETNSFRNALVDYCQRTKSELVCARVPATDTALIAVLQQAGFVYVDFSVLTTLARLKPESPPAARFSMRPAETADHDPIYQTCSAAFHFGRYHTDPRFPRELANRRYVHWMRRALNYPDPGDFVFALGKPGNLTGFMHVALHENNADLRLGAATPGSPLGYWLYVETLRSAYALGARTVTTSISAANSRVLQIYSALGFQFSSPEVVLHWHSPHATHLV
jgi:hypothetical protein